MATKHVGSEYPLEQLVALLAVPPRADGAVYNLPGQMLPEVGSRHWSVTMTMTEDGHYSPVLLVGGPAQPRSPIWLPQAPRVQPDYCMDDIFNVTKLGACRRPDFSDAQLQKDNK